MQKSVAAFVKKYGLSCGETIRYMDLVSEVGELGKEIVKGSDYGKSEYANTEELQGEVGDCLFSLMALCCELGIDSNSALNEAMAKYERRFADKADIGSGE